MIDCAKHLVPHGDDTEVRSLIDGVASRLGTPAVLNAEQSEVHSTVYTNVHHLFTALPQHSPIRPPLVATLTRGLTPGEASDLTGLALSLIHI